MRTLRRIGLLGLAGVVIAGFAAPAAHAADTPEAFSATGTARALHISVLGQDATFGVTDGNVGSGYIGAPLVTRTATLMVSPVTPRDVAPPLLPENAMHGGE